MALQIKVQVSAITNLTDARYCAGMGVDSLGFCIDENSNDFIGYKKIQDIMQWISGIAFVGEIQSNLLKLPEQVFDYGFDFLALNLTQVETINQNLPKEQVEKQKLILHLPFSNDLEALQNNLQTYSPRITYFILESAANIDLLNSENKKLCQILANLSQTYPLFLGKGFAITADNVLTSIDLIKPEGITLQGGNETKVGFKDLEDLALILEKLETD
jgi:phosphoribosylanthranilate isomerase